MPTQANGPSERPLDVLIVDDMAESRTALCALVTSLGHEVAEASGGVAALEAVRRRAPDILLLDLLMPDLDGFEVTRRVRALTADRWLPVIVISSLQGDEHFCGALRNGADDFLVRPVNVELLDAKLKHYSRVLALQHRLGVASQRQRDIYDNLADAVLTLDADGRVCDLNLSACRHFGDGSPAGLLGTACSELVGQTLADLLAQTELSLRRSDGSAMQVELSVSEWMEEGRVRYTFVLRDLTERRQIDRMKDEFLATVSHELRTPLTSILGAIGLLASGAAGAMSEPAQKLAAVARRNAERLGRLIDDLLDLTKIESDRLVLKLRSQPVGALIAEAMAANQGYANKLQVLLQAEVNDTDARREVRVDSDRFAQVMANLLSNAIKHAPLQSVVTVGLTATARRLHITVRDQGPGLPAEFRTRMFEKFSQADGSDRRAQGGTGLGLYVTRLLVERMGGRINADAVSGPGAQFSVDFPDAAVATVAPSLQLWHIDRDSDARRRMAQWLGPAMPVRSLESLHDVALSADADITCVIVGDPVGQGSAEDFCAGMRRLSAGGRALLYSDAVDADFAQRMGLPWLSKSTASRADVEREIRRAVLHAHKAASL